MLASAALCAKVQRVVLAASLLCVFVCSGRLDAQAPSRWTAGVFWRSGFAESGGIAVSHRAFGSRALWVYLDATAAKRISTPRQYFACIDSPCALPDQRVLERRYSLGISAEWHRPHIQGVHLYGIGSAAVTETHWQVLDGGVAHAAQLGLGGGLAFDALGGMNRLELRVERIFDAVRPIRNVRVGLVRSW